MIFCVSFTVILVFFYLMDGRNGLGWDVKMDG